MRTLRLAWDWRTLYLSLCHSLVRFIRLCHDVVGLIKTAAFALLPPSLPLTPPRLLSFGPAQWTGAHFAGSYHLGKKRSRLNFLFLFFCPGCFFFLLFSLLTQTGWKVAQTEDIIKEGREREYGVNRDWRRRLHYPPCEEPHAEKHYEGISLKARLLSAVCKTAALDVDL